MPRAYGLVPAAIVGPGAVLAAAGPEEAIWLGLQAVEPSSPVTVRVRAEGSPPVDAVTGEPWEDAPAAGNHLTCPPDYCLPGLRVPTGHLPFGEGELTLLLEDPIQAQVSIQIVPPDRFTQITGEQVTPLDPDSAYKGWRLP